MTDTAKLKAAALAATPGPWRYQKTTPVTDAEISAENHTRVVNLLAGDVTTANSEFVAAANPAAVLELIAALEAAEGRIAELEARTVKLPPCVDDLHGVGMVMSADAVTEALSAAGINLETGGEA
ncbi:ead/Ea22-like family protein [Cronobacter dublinensis]